MKTVRNRPNENNRNAKRLYRRPRVNSMSLNDVVDALGPAQASYASDVSSELKPGNGRGRLRRR